VGQRAPLDCDGGDRVGRDRRRGSGRHFGGGFRVTAQIGDAAADHEQDGGGGEATRHPSGSAAPRQIAWRKAAAGGRVDNFLLPHIRAVDA